MHKPELPPFDHRPKAYGRPSAEELLRSRRQFLNPGLFLYYKRPLMIVEGKAQYVFDEHGQRYLDRLGGIVTVSVGHCHPDVVQAAVRQNELLQHSTTIYLHPNIVEYAEKLAWKMPGELTVCYFVNSGSEANDLALLMARAYTGNYDVISLRNSYHGGNVARMGLAANRTRTFCSMYWIERLASYEVTRMTRNWPDSLSTHAQPDVDSIHGAEACGLPEAKPILARDSHLSGAFADRG